MQYEKGGTSTDGRFDPPASLQGSSTKNNSITIELQSGHYIILAATTSIPVLGGVIALVYNESWSWARVVKPSLAPFSFAPASTP